MSRENSYATLDADGQVPAGQLDNAPGSHPDLAAHDTLGLVTDSILATHAADSTAVHGIADTSLLSTTAHDHDADYEAAGGIATHAGLADPHAVYLKEADFDDVDFLVGTATGLTAAEIVVGTSPGGELGGTWASPTVDATHSGSTHGAAVTTHEGLADPHTGYRLESADHTHASTGIQGGTIAHSATTGQTANDHHAQTHATAHQPGGADTMAVDAIAATGSLRTLGIGAAQASAGDHVHAGGGEFITTPADFAINNVADQTIATRTVTGIVAGDQIAVDAWFTILNNSTATRVITLTLDFDALFDIELATGALATSATLIHPMKMSSVLDVRSTSLAYAVVQLDMQLLAGIASGTDTTATATLMNAMGWGTTGSNATGSTDVTLKARSANATATQTLRLHHFSVRKVTPN